MNKKAPGPGQGVGGGRGNCHVCHHDQRDAIEVAICSGLSHASIARRFDVPDRSVANHGREHLTAQQKAAIICAQARDAGDNLNFEKLADLEREGLLAGMIKQRARLLQYADQATEAGDIRAAVQAEAAVMASFANTAKMVGRMASINVKHDHTHVLTSPDYLAFRRKLVGALKLIPAEHRATIAKALHDAEADAAAKIAPTMANAPSATPAPPTHQIAPVIDAEYSEVPAPMPPPPY